MTWVTVRKAAEELQFECLSVSASVKILHCISGTEISKGNNAAMVFFNANIIALKKNVRANKTLFV